MTLDLLAALLKGLVYAGALAGAGGALASASLGLGRGPVAQASAQIVSFGASLLAVAGAAFFAVFVVRLGGLDLEILRVAVATAPARAAALQLASAGGLIASVLWRRPFIGVISALVAVLAFAINGHAPAVASWAGAVAGLHVAAAGWWMGALMLLRAGRTCLEEGAFADLVRHFGRQALAVVTGLVVLGAVLGLRLLDGNMDFARSYPRFLMVKFAFAAGALAIALHNRVVLTPRLGKDGAVTNRLARAAGLEIGLIGAVLATTALMTTFASPEMARSAT